MVVKTCQANWTDTFVCYKSCRSNKRWQGWELRSKQDKKKPKTQFAGSFWRRKSSQFYFLAGQKQLPRSNQPVAGFRGGRGRIKVKVDRKGRFISNNRTVLCAVNGGECAPADSCRGSEVFVCDDATLVCCFNTTFTSRLSLKTIVTSPLRQKRLHWPIG